MHAFVIEKCFTREPEYEEMTCMSVLNLVIFIGAQISLHATFECELEDVY